MTDPRRWREDAAELGPDERRLLQAGLRPSVPRGAKRAVWLALGAQLPAAVAAASTASTGTLTAVALVKSASIGLLLGATAVGAVAVVKRETRPTRAPSAVVHAPAASGAARPGRMAPVAAPRPPAAAEALPTSLPLKEPARSLPRPTLSPAPAAPPVSAGSEAAFPNDGPAAHDAESRRVAGARQLLRAGRAREALGVLEQTGREFPNGELAQEREALAIEALGVLGQAEEARRRAAAFLTRYPKSPHAALVRRALENRR